MDLYGISNNLQRSECVSSRRWWDFKFRQGFCEVLWVLWERQQVLLLSRSQRPWAQWCCQPFTPCSLWFSPSASAPAGVCCAVVECWLRSGKAMGLLLGIGLGKQRGAWPGPGCLSLTAGERTLSLQCVGARWWVEEAACGATPSSLALHLGSEFLAEMSPVPKQGSAQ